MLDPRRRVDSVKKLGFGFALALLIGGILIGANPIPAPAADSEIAGEPAPATPVATGSAAEPADPCAIDLASEIEPTPEPEIDIFGDGATPVAAPEIEDDICAIADKPAEPVIEPPVDEHGDTPVPAGIPSPAPSAENGEPAGAESPAAVEAVQTDPTPVTGEDPALIGLPEEPVIAEATPAAAGDPGLAGLEIDSDPIEEVVDPALAGIPEPVIDETAAPETPADPMMAGFSIESVEANASEPPLDASNPGSPTATGEAVERPGALVSVDVISAGGAVTPGGQIIYQFRVANAGRLGVTFRLEASIDRPNWTVSVSVPPGSAGSDGLIRLEAGASIIVGVIVTAPDDALAGEKTETTLSIVNLR